MKILLLFFYFSSFAVEIDGILWMTSEHAYQADKFNSKEIREEIRLSRSAHDSKKIAKKYIDKIREDWDDIKLSIMEEILRHKLEQHPFIKKRLLETGYKIIAEDSPVDSFWGWGSDKKEKIILENFG